MLFDISVIICAYSEARWQLLLAAVDSVRCQTVQPREIILVIDHNPALVTRARLTLPDVVVSENSGQQGLSGARNTGIALARGSVLAFLDDDACAEPDWLEHLLSGYADPRVVGVGGAIEPVWAAGRPAWFPPEFDWVVGCTYRGLPETPSSVRNLIGANMSMRANLFDGLGGFQDGIGRVRKLPAGCEETELCIRASQRWPGSVFLYDPSVKITHHVSAERSTWIYFCTRCFAEGRSKALVVGLVGASDGLASERSYLRRTLPLAVVSGIQDVFSRGDWSGMGRAAAIVVGVMITGSGFLMGSWPRRWSGPTVSAGAGEAVIKL